MEEGAGAVRGSEGAGDGRVADAADGGFVLGAVGEGAGGRGFPRRGVFFGFVDGREEGFGVGGGGGEQAGGGVGQVG